MYHPQFCHVRCTLADLNVSGVDVAFIRKAVPCSRACMLQQIYCSHEHQWIRPGCVSSLCWRAIHHRSHRSCLCFPSRNISQVRDTCVAPRHFPHDLIRHSTAGAGPTCSTHLPHPALLAIAHRTQFRAAPRACMSRCRLPGVGVRMPVVGFRFACRVLGCGLRARHSAMAPCMLCIDVVLLLSAPRETTKAKP